MKHLLFPIGAATLLLVGCGQSDGAKSEKAGSATTPAAGNAVWAAGSSTVFPFATRVAENVGRSTGGAAARVESLGTGGGFKLFCNGLGAGSPDVANASRPIKKSEWDACQAAGVTEIIEIKVGYDGIVVANDKKGAAYNLTLGQLYKALAAELPKGAASAPNPAKAWSDVDRALPKDRILVYGPPPTSGTRDAFVELGLEAGAKTLPQLKALKESDEEAFKARAHRIRSDGAWVDSGENDNAIIQTLTKTPGSLGVFGYSFLDNNMDKVKAARIDGVGPSMATIADGSYPLARSLYIYVKKANLATKPGLRDFMNGFVSDAASGKGGYLLQRGLIPLSDAEREAQKLVVKEMTTMKAPAS